MFALVTALVVTGAVGYFTLSTFKITGPYYQRIIEGKDVIADVVPPPVYIVEPYLLAHQLVMTREPAEIARLASRIEILFTGPGGYDERHNYWAQRLEAGPLRTALVDDADRAATEFHARVTAELLPMVQSGHQAAAAVFLHDHLTPVYERHLAAAKEAVSIANHQNAAIEADARDRIRFWSLAIVAVIVTFVALTLALSIPFTQSIVRPTVDLVDVLEAVARGDLTRRLQVESDDELGRMAAALNTTVDAIERTMHQIQESAERDTVQNAELRRNVDAILEVVRAAARGDLTREISVAGSEAISQVGSGLTKLFDDLGTSIDVITGNAHALASSSDELTAVSRVMRDSSEETATRAHAVTASSDSVSRNLQSMATAADQMTASIREIARSAHEAAGVATEAVTAAARTNATIAKLRDSSSDIGNVAKLISSIAEQTHLLALNATIEAARAGEAGKGFAVVANEVRELAKGTANATENIGRMVEDIQRDTSDAVESIVQISAIINRINDYSRTIASAVEEQTVSTNDIGRNVSEAAAGSTDIARHISGVAQSAHRTTQGATETQESASALARMAADLQKHVSHFKVRQNRGQSRTRAA